MTETLKPGTRCECREPFGHDHSEVNPSRCVRDAVRMVTWHRMCGAVRGIPVTQAMCEPCAAYHEVKGRADCIEVTNRGITHEQLERERENERG